MAPLRPHRPRPRRLPRHLTNRVTTPRPDRSAVGASSCSGGGHGRGRGGGESPSASGRATATHPGQLPSAASHLPCRTTGTRPPECAENQGKYQGIYAIPGRRSPCLYGVQAGQGSPPRGARGCVQQCPPGGRHRPGHYSDRRDPVSVRHRHPRRSRHRRRPAHRRHPRHPRPHPRRHRRRPAHRRHPAAPRPSLAPATTRTRTRTLTPACTPYRPRPRREHHPPVLGTDHRLTFIGMVCCEVDLR